MQINCCIDVATMFQKQLFYFLGGFMSRFKNVCLFVCIFLLSGSLWATEGLRSFAASVMTSTDFDGNSVRGWEVTRDGDEVIVKVYTADGTMFEYHCEEADHCHQAGQSSTALSFPQGSDITLAWITEGQNDSFEKFENTIQQKSFNAGNLNSYSVWVHEDTGHGHSHGINIWTEMEYEQIMVYVYCHGHAGESGLFCHYSKSPEGGFDEHDEHADEADHDHHDHHHGHAH